jgi:fumarate reductase subunit D
MWDRDAKKGNEAQFWGTMRGDGGPLKAVVVPVAKNIRAVRAPFAFKNVPLPGEKP